MEVTILRQLTELQGLPYPALKDRWRSLYGTDPPAYKRQHMVRRLAYRIQELAFGGLSEQTKTELERIATEEEARCPMTKKKLRKTKTTRPIPGTRLVRDWNGHRHIVTATTDGFEYNGRRYKSLSAIAKAITGAHWSGPQFFGLRTPKESRP